MLRCLGGGVFANGAITGALSRAFNDEADHGDGDESEEEYTTHPTTGNVDENIRRILFDSNASEKILIEHSPISDKPGKGKFRVEFLVDMDTFRETILIPGINHTGRLKPNTPGPGGVPREGFTFDARLPYSVGRTGSFKGLPNVFTNTVKFVIVPDEFNGTPVYRLMTAFPVRE